MTVKKRKKVTRYRGSKTHGGGAMKKRRGAGNRGGRGMAGTGKRGDAKKPSIWAKDYFGKHGFKKKNKKTINAINLKTVEERITFWADRKLIEVKKDIYHINLGKLGYDKLIGSGNVTRKINIVVGRATEGAVEKIKKAEGNVEVTVKVEKEVPQKKALEKREEQKKEEKAEQSKKEQ